LPALAFDLVEDSAIRFVSGEYREGRRLALEVRAKGLEPGADPNSRFGYQFSGALAPLNLLFLGEWGEALKEFAAAIAQAQKNANDHYTMWLRLDQAAHIEEESGNLESARSYRDLSRATILRLANSLPEQEPLRAIFLSAPAVARVLSRDS
jgi:hypothetical protein